MRMWRRGEEGVGDMGWRLFKGMRLATIINLIKGDSSVRFGASTSAFLRIRDISAVQGIFD